MSQGYSDAEEATSYPVFVRNDRESCKRAADIIMLSSDSDDDAPYVPLAQRLKQREQDCIGAFLATTNGKHEEQYLPSDLAVSELPCLNGFTESEPISSSNQIRTETHRALGGSEEAPLLQWWLKCPSRPTNTSPARKKPAKELQASKQEALKRKQARVGQQSDREPLDKQQHREKAEKKALAEAAKALRPEECMKHIVVVVDSALLQLEGGEALLSSVQALGCTCSIEKQPFPRSVSWMRRSSYTQPDVGVCVQEALVVIQMTVEDFITLIHSYVQEQRHYQSDCGPTLTSWVAALQRHHPDKILSLVVIDLEKYYRSQKSKKKKKKDDLQMLPEVSRVELEEAVVNLQMHTGVQVRFVSTWKDFSDHISMTTKAVAEAPFKRDRDQTAFSFHLESEWAGGERVDRAGKGLLQVWKRQIQQLNRVSTDMASAILAAYPSPQLLNEAYRRCEVNGEKVSLLSDILIRRGQGVTLTTRRVGPELSKRLFLTMNCSDPQQILDSAEN
ncbi:structure-specific endonuclease subunit EME1 isoform X2 [Genypterus blacodes]